MPLRYLFIDLDETLVHSAASGANAPHPQFRCFTHGDYLTILRPDAHVLLQACREEAREVILFTFGERAYAQAICNEFGFGFQPAQILSCEHLLLSPKDLEPNGVLIDDMEPSHKNARVKMATLGIGADRYFQIPPFRPPQFASCRVFTLGLPT